MVDYYWFRSNLKVFGRCSDIYFFNNYIAEQIEKAENQIEGQDVNDKIRGLKVIGSDVIQDENQTEEMTIYLADDKELCLAFDIQPDTHETENGGIIETLKFSISLIPTA